MANMEICKAALYKKKNHFDQSDSRNLSKKNTHIHTHTTCKLQKEKKREKFFLKVKLQIHLRT